MATFSPSLSVALQTFPFPPLPTCLFKLYLLKAVITSTPFFNLTFSTVSTTSSPSIIVAIREAISSKSDSSFHPFILENICCISSIDLVIGRFSSSTSTLFFHAINSGSLCITFADIPSPALYLNLVRISGICSINSISLVLSFIFSNLFLNYLIHPHSHLYFYSSNTKSKSHIQ